jgi:hypothetical protein
MATLHKNAHVRRMIEEPESFEYGVVEMEKFSCTTNPSVQIVIDET